MPTGKGNWLNCFALLSRTSQCLVKTGEHSFSAQFILEQFQTLSFKSRKLTVVVLDNARIHTSQIIKERIKIWQQRGFISLLFAEIFATFEYCWNFVAKIKI